MENDSFYIGRDPSNNLVLDEDAVSRNHARVFVHKDDFYLEDMHSTNGSFVNGKRVRQKFKLHDNDLITIGERHVFEFKMEEISLMPETDGVSTNSDEEMVDKEQVKQEESLVKTSTAKVKEDSTRGVVQFFSRFPTWALIIIISIGFLILFCLIPFVVIEVTDQWCNLFSGFFNAMSPGICP